MALKRNCGKHSLFKQIFESLWLGTKILPALIQVQRRLPARSIVLPGRRTTLLSELQRLWLP
jgi:hypothetical protein